MGKPLPFLLCLKNVTMLSCYNFDVSEPILIIFGKIVTKKVSNQKVALFSRQRTGCDKQKNKNRIFSLTSCITVLPDFNQSLA